MASKKPIKNNNYYIVELKIDRDEIEINIFNSMCKKYLKKIH
jgi:hypothetical protein